MKEAAFLEKAASFYSGDPTELAVHGEQELVVVEGIAHAIL